MRYIWLVLAVAFIIMGLWLYLQTTRCKHTVRATFTDVHVMKSTFMKDYFPIFRYEYDGCEYHVRSIQSFSRRYLNKNFVIGRQYTVYIDPDKPRNMAISNKPQPADYVVMAIGLACLVIFFLRG